MGYRYPDWEGWGFGRTAVIAEVGINHGGDEALAWEMITAAHENGADFVKLQSYVTESMFHPSLKYYDAKKKQEIPFDGLRRLFAGAREKGIALITTPFDEASLAVVEEFSPAAHKIASMDNDNLPLIEKIASTGRPVIVSAGMGGIGEMEKIQDIMDGRGNGKLAVLHCVSDYPADLNRMHLGFMETLRAALGCPVGLSDHSLGLESSFAAASLGAAAIEKHFTTSRGLDAKIPATDNAMSIEPAELKQLRRFCELAPVMMGSGRRRLTENEEFGKKAYKRGMYAKRAVKAGETVSLDTVIFLRPATGIRAGHWEEAAGKEFRRDIEKLEPIHFSDLR